MAIRSCSLFYNSKRVGKMQQVTFELDTGDGQEETDDGTHFTDGRAKAKVTCKAISPVAGTGVNILRRALDKRDDKLSVGIIEGGIANMVARLKTAKYDGDVATGKLTADFEFMCSEPTLTG